MLLALVLSVACNGEQPRTDDPPENVITVSAREYGFDANPLAGTGVLTIAATNAGQEIHQFMVMRLAQDMSQEEMAAFFSERPGELPEGAELAGGVTTLDPGLSAHVSQEFLIEGTYVFLCYLPAPDGMPKAAHGMHAVFELRDQAFDALPAAGSVFTVSGDGIEVPDTVPAGRTRVEIRNDTGDDRPVAIHAMREGRTIEDAEGWVRGGMRGEAPATFHGGGERVPAGSVIVVELDLEPGRAYTVRSVPHETDFTPQ